MRHVHFIGIGGIGVSGIAQLAFRRGDKVTGSDIKGSGITRRLASLGITVRIGHKPENIEGADLVVYSSAIKEDNAELKAARARKVPVQKRAEFLSGLMADKKVITVTGAHGKTTTSSLAAKLLTVAGLHPTAAVGGILLEEGDNVRWGPSDYFVAEADESDGTFLCYHPAYSIITNIDHEHMDFFGTTENLLDAFARFVAQTQDGGRVIYFHEDLPLRSIVARSKAQAVSFGFSEGADFTPVNISLRQCALSFSCLKKGKPLGDFSLRLMGRHNIANALAVIALSDALGIDLQKTREALADFKGVERRFQVKREDEGILIVDDYAHHPTEIAATIEAARLCAGRRLLVVFQPHRYTRTKSLLDRFAESFIKSDQLVVTDIYAAGEPPLEGVTAKTLAEKVKTQTKTPVDYVARGELVAYLKKNVRPRDLVLFLGAGDITKVSDEFAKNFKT